MSVRKVDDDLISQAKEFMEAYRAIPEDERAHYESYLMVTLPLAQAIAREVVTEIADTYETQRYLLRIERGQALFDVLARRPRHRKRGMAIPEGDEDISDLLGPEVDEEASWEWTCECGCELTEDERRIPDYDRDSVGLQIHRAHLNRSVHLVIHEYPDGVRLLVKDTES